MKRTGKKSHKCKPLDSSPSTTIKEKEKDKKTITFLI
jgi:hypothetical protein